MHRTISLRKHDFIYTVFKEYFEFSKTGKTQMWKTFTVVISFELVTIATRTFSIR